MKNIKHQIAEIDLRIANYQVQLKMLKVEILKLELKKEKLMDKIILQSLKAKIATRRQNREADQ